MASLIDGVLQMAAISSLQSPTRDSILGQSDGQLTNVRKMLVSLVDDVRVALIKLAERTCAIRAVKTLIERSVTLSPVKSLMYTPH